MELIKDLLLQALLVLFPVFLYQVLLLKSSNSLHNTWPQWKTLSILCILSTLLCMTFSVRIDEGYIFDLSIIPLIISIVYGGLLPGILTFSSIFLFQFAIEEDAIFITLINNSFVIILTFLFVIKYKEPHRLTKISYFTGLVCITLIIEVLGQLYILVNTDTFIEEYLFLIICFPLIGVLTIWISVHLIENMREKLLMEKEIHRAERLNVIGHLAASVAHEIRNPMTVVRGFMQIFYKESFIPDDKKEYLKLMIQELDRAETIINDYLALAKPRVDKSEQIDIEKQIYFVKDIISSYALLNNVRIVERLESDLCIKGNPEKLNQVLINLIKNAIEASPEGGEIAVAAYKEKSKIVIDISDSGVGLTNEEMKRLGSPFYSTKENGTGLGLMVCYGIVEAMYGKIEVHSEKGKGTIFSIRLPAA